MESKLKNGLKWKYRVMKFLRITEQGKEAIWLFGIVAFGLVAISYFVAHALLLITNFYY